MKYRKTGANTSTIIYTRTLKKDKKDCRNCIYSKATKQYNRVFCNKFVISSDVSNAKVCSKYKNKNIH